MVALLRMRPSRDARVVCPAYPRTASAWRRDPSWAERASSEGGIHLSLGIGEPTDVLAEQARRVDQRREWREVARVGVQAQEVEPNRFQSRDALCQVRRGTCVV